MKKVLKTATYAIMLIILLTAIVLGVLYFNELRTLISVNMVEGTNLYTMEYFSDYHFDEFLEIGAASNNEYYSVINEIFDGKVNIGVGASADNACSAFTARTDDGSRLLARNLDNTANPVMLVVTNPDGAYKSISAVNLATIGYSSESSLRTYDFRALAAPYFPTDGMNENGISITMLQVNFSRKQKDENLTTINAYSYIRLVLDYAATIDEALQLADDYNFYFDTSLMAHFLICDSSGSSVILEYVDGEKYVIENDGTYQVASNFNNTEENFDEYGYVHADKYNEWLTGSSLAAYDSEYSGYVRYDLMSDFLYNNSGILSLDDCFDLLESVASPTQLQYGIVYNMTTLEATVITDNDWSNRVTVGLA